MTPDELVLWEDANLVLKGKMHGYPCLDCPMWFALEMRAVDRCNGVPSEGLLGRPRKA